MTTEEEEALRACCEDEGACRQALAFIRAFDAGPEADLSENDTTRTAGDTLQQAQPLLDLLRATYDGLLIHGRVILAASSGLASHFGYRRRELTGTELRHLVAPTHREAYLHHLQQEKREAFTAPMLRKDGSTRFMELVTLPLDHSLQMTALRDVTAREENRRRESFLACVLSHLQDAIFVTDLRGRVLYWNEGAEALFGAKAEQAVGLHLEELLSFSGPDHFETEAAVRLLQQTCSLESEVHVSGAGLKEDKYVALTRCLLKQAGEATGVLAIARDITPRVRIEEQLTHSAMHDALTGVANRSLFMSRLWSVILEAGARPDYRFALLFVDLDRFKLVNDSLGHQMGDRLLVQIGQRLSRELPAHFHAGRLGGDEFGILIEEVADLREATAAAAQIQQKLAEPYMLGGSEVFIDTSIGIVLGDSSYHLPEDVLHDADTAMYRAKDIGTGTYVVFDPSMRTRVASLLQLGVDLRRAVRTNEFVVYYQPILYLDTGAVAGFEALVRWQHPERGLISPTAFIAFAEETGLILPIERYVLREACRQVGRWAQEYPGWKPGLLSANVSVKQLHQVDYVDHVRAALGESGLEPAALMLEITERVFMQQSDYESIDLPLLKRLGVQICIDDFGTGYSSLSQLHGLPVDAVKIDRAFTARLTESRRGLELARAILGIAGSLGLRVVAEGVETPEQLALLRRLGCTYVQGFLFARPLPAGEAAALLAEEPPWLKYWQE